MEYVRFIKNNARWLVAGILLAFSSSYGQTYFISIFAGEIRQEFGLSHGAWGGIYSAGTTASAVVMVWAGMLSDKYRVRQLGSVVLALLAIACIFMANLSSIWMLPVAIFLLRLFGQGMTSHIVGVAMARWFIATRGRAISIATMGFAIGQAALPIAFVALLTILPWRTLWMIAAALAVLVIPIVIVLLKNERTPNSIANETHATGMNGIHWVRSAVLRHWLFWLMIPSLLGPSTWGTALMFQQVHLSQVKGWTHAEFVSLLPMFTVASILSTFVAGWAIDRYGTKRLMVFQMLPYAVAFQALANADSLFLGALGLTIFGIGAGASSTLPAAFSAEFFGTRNIGSIKSLFTAIMVLGSAMGPGITGWLIDKGIDFPDQMFGIAIYFVIAAILAGIGVYRAAPSLAVTPQIDIIRS